MEENENARALLQTVLIPYGWLTYTERERVDAFVMSNWIRVCEAMNMNCLEIEALEGTTHDRNGKIFSNKARKAMDYFLNRFKDTSLNKLYEIFHEAGIQVGCSYLLDLMSKKFIEHQEELKKAKELEDLALKHHGTTSSNGFDNQQKFLPKKPIHNCQTSPCSIAMECEDNNKCRYSLGINSSSAMRNDSSQTYTEETSMEYDDSHSRQLSHMNFDHYEERNIRTNGLRMNNLSNAMDCQMTNQTIESQSCNSTVVSKNVILPEDLSKIFARPGYNTGTFPNASKKRDLSKFRSRVLIAYDSSDKKNIDKITNIACWLIKNKFRVEFDDFKQDLVKENRDCWMWNVYKQAPFVLLCITPSFERNLLEGKDTSVQKIWNDIEERLKKDPSNREGNSIVPLLISPTKRVPPILKTIVHYKWKEDWQSLSFFLSAPYKLPINKDSKSYSIP
ncbi:DgyrCDS14333 [Dimorphilus gyrociliatus]|uniref:DgyrCDS14333 n=1 Tax=Dimorphilus gyrociliatus TaxID=2664684 RepID=A0A7I8WDI1_9ANNE|nr:DgyrCDS14333 [Dimorphilus gyrociliatus]